MHVIASACVCVCVCVTSSNFEPGDQVSQNLVRPLHNALPINDNSAVGTSTLSLDRQLTYFAGYSGSVGFLCFCCKQRDMRVSSCEVSVGFIRF